MPAFSQELFWRWSFTLVPFALCAKASGFRHCSLGPPVNMVDAHRFFLRGGGTSYAVNGLIVRGSSSTCSHTTMTWRPVCVQPNVAGRPVESLGTVRLLGLPTTS